MNQRKRTSTLNRLAFLALLFAVTCVTSCSPLNEVTATPKTSVPSPTKILAENITISAYLLPEFKIDVHSTKSEGNQIFGIVRTMLQDKKGNFWFGGQGGLATYNGSELLYFDLRDDNNQGITVKVIVQDETDAIWIGHTGGITKYDGEYFTNYNQNDGLINNDVWSLMTDTSGRIWIGTLAGVCYFDGEIFSPFNLPNAKLDSTRGVTSTKIVTNIMQDSKGKIWFGTNGGAYVYNGDSLTNISEKEGLCNNRVADITEDLQGNIWLATIHNGMCILKGDKFTVNSIGEQFNNAEVGNVVADKMGNIWFTVKGQGVFCFDGTTCINYSVNQGLEGSPTFSIYQDQAGNMWFVGFKGAYRYNGKSIINITRNGPWLN